MKNIFSKVVTMLIVCVMLVSSMGTLVFAGDVDTMPYFTGAKTWNLSDSAKAKIARIMTGEGGEEELYASRLLLSHFANLCEERGATSEKQVLGVINSWYNSASERSKPSDEAWQAMEEVLIKGYRFLPRYVTEYDGFCELYQSFGSGKIKMDGQSASNRKQAAEIVANAIPHKTWVKGPYGGAGYFYTYFHDGYNGNIFYYDPEGKLYNKYKSDDDLLNASKVGLGIPIYISGKRMSTDKGAAFINDAERTMVPLRAFAETVGREVYWEAANKTIIISGKPEVYFQVGAYNYAVGNESFDMDTTPEIIGDRTYIPLRFAAEALGYKVTWDGVNKVAYCE